MLESKLIPKKVYKIYHNHANGGRVIHSFARYDGTDKKKGNTFTLLNKPDPIVIHYTDQELEELSISTQPYVWGKPKGQQSWEKKKKKK